MRCLLFTAAAALLLGCNTSLGQVSTIGTTALGLPTTPGAIFTSPLNGPSPFSAATLPNTPDTTLAPVPLASDPTTPGTAVTCATSTGQIAPATLTVSAIGSKTGSTPAAPLGTIPILGSTTGTISPVSPLGSPSTTGCSSTPGGPPTNGAALPLSTPEIPDSPPPGTIPPVVAQLVDTSIDPNLTVVPAPNSAACSEGVTMNLANLAMMTLANATGATATLGVSPPSPPGC